MVKQNITVKRSSVANEKVNRPAVEGVKKVASVEIFGVLSKSPKKRTSVVKTLTSLLSVPSNRSCADCRSALVDPSQVHASFCPSREDTHKYPELSVAIHDFHLNHKAFAPPDIKKEPKFGSDPAFLVNQRFGGHGVFICAQCAAAHKQLGASIAVVQAVQECTSWTEEQAQFMKGGGGNARSWVVYEAYMPESWKKRRPNPSSTPAERLFFGRAKYEALAFCMPPPGPLADLAWVSILERNQEWKRFSSNDLRNLHHLTTPQAMTPATNAVGRPGFDDELPNRLIDYFCVVSCSRQLHPGESERDLSKVKSAQDLAFWPHVSDCFPSRTAHDDTEFPGHLASFVLPEGCTASPQQMTPTFFTFVLTLGDGERLYGGVLQIYDEHVDVEALREAVLSSGYTGELPPFLNHSDDSDVFFFPKCLVILSHHAFFDLFREILLQLYRITLVEAPLPVERYVANFACEVPLPPQGQIKVEFGFSVDKMWSIERPPLNQLPMANFSFRPLFATLSVGNILTVMGCLMSECKVAILSEHYSILCPVAEALLSALFPFTWQGLYIPVMPYAMLDILDAPIPFLVGLHGRYLQKIDPKNRPQGVVFVDLDRDVVHLGFDDETGRRRSTPCLPPKDALKLKTALEDHGSSVYIIPNTGLKGCIMTGNSLLLIDEERQRYSQMKNIEVDPESLGRKEVFEMTDKAYHENDLSTGMGGFRTEHGQLSSQDTVDTANSNGSQQTTRRKSSARKLRKPNLFVRKQKPVSADYDGARSQAHLLDLTEPEGFSSAEIRNAFLRFFVTVFKGYGGFVLEDKGNDLFDEDMFVDDKKLKEGCLDFLQRVLQTQMFQRFLEQQKDNPDTPELRFFDESIIAKNNRSKKANLTMGGKKPTPFLDDTSGKITKTFTPPPPSNLGLPDVDTTYHYGTFPAFDYNLFGRIRAPVIWPQNTRESMRFRKSSSYRVRVTQQEIVRKAMKPLITAPATIYAVAKRSAKDLESVLAALSPMNSSRSNQRASCREVPEAIMTTSTEASVDSAVTVSTLSRADTIVMNARRKQGILLELVIEFQACCRRYLAQRKYKKFRRAVFQLQRKFLHVPLVKNDAEIIDWRERRAVLMQRHARSYLARVHARRRLAAIGLIQRWCRGETVRRPFRRLKHATILAQKLERGRRARFVFDLVRNLVSKVQARARGMQVRKRVTALFQRQMPVYKKQIFSLWQTAHTSLSFRTKLWPCFALGTGFLRLRVAELELVRLWKVLGINPKKNEEQSVRKEKSAQFGVDSMVFCHCMKVMKMMENDLLQESSSVTFQSSHKFEEAERQQIYVRLDEWQSVAKDLQKIYSTFGIPGVEKKKKVLLSNLIWTRYKNVQGSCDVMRTLFPELGSALQIIFHSPGGKAVWRFSMSRTVAAPPVEKTLWEKASLEGLIKKHMNEVTTIMSTRFPPLLARLENMERQRLETHKSQVDAAMKSRGISNWLQCQNVLIAGYLSCRYSSKVHESYRKNCSEINPMDKAYFPDIDPINGDILNSSQTDGVNFPDIDLQNITHDISTSAPSFPDVLDGSPVDAEDIKVPSFPDIFDGRGADPEAVKKAVDSVKATSFPDVI